MARSNSTLATVLALALGAAACTEDPATSSGGTGGSATGTGGRPSTGTGGTVTGTGGTVSGTGGTASGTGGSVSGTGGSVSGTGGSGTGGSASGTGGSGAEVGAETAAETGGGDAPTAGKITLTVDHMPGPNGRLCFKKEATNSGGNQSPKIDWTGIPAEAKSLVLTMKDHQGQAHNVACNIPTSITGFMANIKNMFPTGVEFGFGNGKTSWYGPGAGVRPYEFRIWAITTETFDGGCKNSNAAHDKIMKDYAAKAPYILGFDGKILYGEAAGNRCQ